MLACWHLFKSQLKIHFITFLKMSENETFLTCFLSCVLGLSQVFPSLFKSREIHNFIQACFFTLQAKTT